MDRANLQNIETLERYIGKDIIRTVPASHAVNISLDDSPVTLIDINKNGRMIVAYSKNSEKAAIYGTSRECLPIELSDGNWTLYENALKAEENPLNKWIGKKIRRTAPTKVLENTLFMKGEIPVLLSASKNHMLVKFKNLMNFEETRLLGPDFVDGEWELVNED